MRLKDRIEAVVRSEKYRRDFEVYKKSADGMRLKDVAVLEGPLPQISLSPAGQALCGKYGIPYPIDPDEEVTELPSGKRLPQSNIAKFIPTVVPVNPPQEGGGAFVIDLSEGKLRVEIDITKPTKDILRDTKALCRYVKSFLEGPKRRQKETTFDYWWIYDQATRDKKTPREIAKVLAERENISPDSPKYDEALLAFAKRVERAIRKAEKQLKEVDGQAASDA